MKLLITNWEYNKMKKFYKLLKTESSKAKFKLQRNGILLSNLESKYYDNFLANNFSYEEVH